MLLQALLLAANANAAVSPRINRTAHQTTPASLHPLRKKRLYPIIQDPPNTFHKRDADALLVALIYVPFTTKTA